MKLNKYLCKGCNTTIGPTNEFLRKCEDCGSSLLEKLELKVEDWIRFCELELEAANHHEYIELPGKLFNKLLPYCKHDDKEILARIIAEEFYNNI